MPDTSSETALAEIRREIDRIDEGMHGLLMERGRIIDRLIATKGTVASGTAFRPEREAAMMRVLADRHAGRLPVEAVEGIWRIIISTFTYVQAPFGVHAEPSAGEAEMRDTARFHFGFTVPFRSQPNAAAVIAAVAESKGDLGLIAGLSPGAWWQMLEPEAAPKIIAKLPFTRHPDHPAAVPAFVVSKALSNEGVGAIALYSARGRAAHELEAALDGAGGHVVATHDGAALIGLPHRPGQDVAALLSPAILVPIGGHPSQTVAPDRGDTTRPGGPASSS